MQRSGRLLCVAFAIWLFASGTASAHPLGNFTINHLTRIAHDGKRVTLHYVLDMAEIPTFSLLRDLAPSGKPSVEQLAAWSNRERTAILAQLHLAIDGAAISLEAGAAGAVLRPGAGGLSTLYWTATYHAPLGPGRHTIEFSDGTFAHHLGWKDVVAGTQSEPTRALTAYPGALAGSPRDRTLATIALDAGGAMRISEANAAERAQSGGSLSTARSNQLSDMLARGTANPWIVLLTVLVAVALGALHALEPGHGKTLLAVSLVGARATVPQAAILAGGLTFAHTIGVLLLGVAVLFLSRWIVPSTIYPWITLASGIVVAVIGARALARVATKLRPVTHAHGHEHPHTHPHEHPHSHGLGGDAAHAHLDDEAHAAAHRIDGSAPLTFPGVVLAAMSGAIAPCPAALVVLLAAVNLHQIPYGLTVIVAFSFGLAAVLTGLGIAVVRGAAWLSKRSAFDRFVRYGPVLSAGAIACIGSVMIGDGFSAQGVGVPAAAISAIAIVAIVGYALSALGHGHGPPAHDSVHA